MLNHVEQKILEVLRQKHLVTITELSSYLKSDGGNGALQKLRSMGLVDKVESLGTCIVITQKGIRALKENKF